MLRSKRPWSVIGVLPPRQRQAGHLPLALAFKGDATYADRARPGAPRQAIEGSRAQNERDIREARQPPREMWNPGSKALEVGAREHRRPAKAAMRVRLNEYRSATRPLHHVLLRVV